MKPHPAVPAAIVIKHVQGSKNRVIRHAKDAENVRLGMRALYEDANALRASLQNRPDEIAILEAGFMALEFVAKDLVVGHEQMIAMEQALQEECLLWLNRKRPKVPVGPRQPAICYVPSKATEVETPKAILEGQEPKGDPTKEPDARAFAGFYRMEDGTLVFVNHQNEPIAPPTDPQVLALVKELVRDPNTKNEGYLPVAPSSPTLPAPQPPEEVGTPSVEMPPLPEKSNGTGSIVEQ